MLFPSVFRNIGYADFFYMTETVHYCFFLSLIFVSSFTVWLKLRKTNDQQIPISAIEWRNYHCLRSLTLTMSNFKNGHSVTNRSNKILKKNHQYCFKKRWLSTRVIHAVWNTRWLLYFLSERFRDRIGCPAADLPTRTRAPAVDLLLFC